MPTTMFLRQAAALLQRPHHGVERIGDADDEGVRRVFLDAGADLIHHLEIDAEQIVAAHAGLARHAGGDDAHVGAFDGLVGVGAGEFRVEALDRRGLRDVERFALRDALRDVEHHDVAEFFEADQVSERAADLAGADQCNLLARHEEATPIDGAPRNRGRRWLNAKADRFKSTKGLGGVRFRVAAVIHYTRRQGAPISIFSLRSSMGRKAVC